MEPLMTQEQSVNDGASARLAIWSGYFSIMTKGPLLTIPLQPVNKMVSNMINFFMIFSLVHRQYVLLRNSSTIVYFNHKQAIDSGY